MLRRFHIDNFKSLTDFSLPMKDDKELGQLVCLVGINGSGKSTVLQAFDFVAHLVTGNISAWITSRGWEGTQLTSKRAKKRLITFTLEFHMPYFGTHVWTGSFNPQLRRCTHETLSFDPVHSFSDEVPPDKFVFENGAIRDTENRKIDVAVEFEGSVFGAARYTAFPNKTRYIVALLRYYLEGVKSMELLSPHLMRKQSRDAEDVGYGGEKIAAFVNGLDQSERDKLLHALNAFYPRLTRVGARSGKYGWKRLFASEKYIEEIESDSRHINDGFLRLVAIIAQTVATRRQSVQIPPSQLSSESPQKEYQFILLDEIENGINPELVERLIKYLLTVRQQIFFTTHSPIILNYLSDEVARESVFLIYRGPTGGSSCVRLFELPELAESLTTMGPGEAYMDVGLERISNELSNKKGVG